VTLRKWQMLETAFALRPVLFRALDAPTSGASLCSWSIHHRHDAGDAAQSDLRDFCNRSIPPQAPAPAPAKWQGAIAKSSEIAGADFCPSSPPLPVGCNGERDSNRERVAPFVRRNRVVTTESLKV
jgi:hypothetical protein